MNADLCFAVLAELLLKSAVLVLAGGLLLTLFRRASAAGRHAVLTAVFVSLLLLPATKLMPQRSFLPLVLKHLRVVTMRTSGGGEPSSGPESPGADTTRAAEPPAVTTLPWSALAYGTWLAGGGLLLGRRVLISLRLRQVVRASTELADEELEQRVRAIVAASGEVVRVRESARCRVPVVAGILRPTVLLPVDAADWDASLLESAMRHELGHIRRRDCLTRGLANMACAVYWPNPLVWLAARRLRLVQEQACDDLVLTSGAQAQAYAGQLMEAVRRLQEGGLEARHAMAMAQPSTLEARVLAIMDSAQNRCPKSRPATLTAAAILAILLAMCSVVQVRGEAEAPLLAVPQIPQVKITTKFVETANAPEEKIKSVNQQSVEGGGVVRMTATTVSGKEAAQTASSSEAPQVRITSKFVEITGETEDLPDFLRHLDARRGKRLSDPEYQAAIRTLCQRKGVDLLSAPSVITRSSMKAVVEVSRDFVFPSDGKKPEVAGKKVGVTFEVTPTVNSTGSLSLHMVPELTEFDGFIDIDDPGSKRTKKRADGNVSLSLGKGSKLMRDYIATGPSQCSAADEEPLVIPSSAKLKRSADGHRHVPMFNTRTLDAEVKLNPGETVLLVCPGRETTQTVEDRVPLLGDIPWLGRLFRSTNEVRYKHHLYVFVTADVEKLPTGKINPPSSPHR